jgi:hypothetical protein
MLIVLLAGSDELGCPEVKENECHPEKQFRCEKSGICIPKEVS